MNEKESYGDASWVESMDLTYKYLKTFSEKRLTQLKIIKNNYAASSEVSDLISTLIFIRRTLMDISKSYKIYFTNKDDDEGQILARNFVIHISEFISDIGKIIGTPLSKWIKSVNPDSFLEAALKELRMEFNGIKKYYPDINAVRNSIAAHKEKDVIKQINEFERLSKINLDEIYLRTQIFMHKFEIMELYLFDRLENGNESLRFIKNQE